MEEYEFKAKPGNPGSAASVQSRRINRASIANLVSRHGITSGISVDASFCLETSAQTNPDTLSLLAVIHFQLDRRTTFARDSIAITSRRRATQPGGNASQSANGFLPCRSTTNNSAKFSPRWIGWIRAF